MSFYDEVKEQLKGKNKKFCVRFAIRCALKVLPLFEAKHPQDKRPREAIKAAQTWLKKPTKTNQKAANAAANAAVDAANAAANAAANVAADAAYTATTTDATADAAYAANAANDAANAAANAVQENVRKEILQLLKTRTQKQNRQRKQKWG